MNDPEKDSLSNQLVAVHAACDAAGVPYGTGTGPYDASERVRFLVARAQARTVQPRLLRPEWDSEYLNRLRSTAGNYACNGCAAHLTTIEMLREHWQLGHFDYVAEEQHRPPTGCSTVAMIDCPSTHGGAGWPPGTIIICGLCKKEFVFEPARGAESP